MRSLLRYNLFFFFSLICTFLSANVYTFRGIAMSDGLSDLLVNVIYKDSTGFVWLGTDNCLDRFDGVNIKHYPFSSADVKRKRVTAIAETDRTHLWIGNGLGLWRLNRETEAMELIVPETIDCAVNSLLYDGNKTLYIGTEKGLFIHHNGVFEHVLMDSNILSSGNRIVSLERGGDGLIWMMTTQQLYAYHPQTKAITNHTAKAGAEHTYLFRCITRIGNVLYLGTANAGIIRYDVAAERFSGFVDVGCNIISSISSDGEDLIYASTDGNGVHFLSHSQQKIVRSFRHDSKDKGSIRSNSVYSLLVDRENLVWIGFYQSGFDYSLYQSALFTVYDYLPHFSSMNRQVRSFLIHGKKKLIGTRDGLYYIDEETGKVRSYVTPDLRSNLILSLAYYEGEYYIGTYGGGLSILNPSTGKVRNLEESKAPTFVKGHIFCLQVDKENNLWLGTSSGVYLYNKERKEAKSYTSANSQLPEGNVYEIFFDSTHKGWLCTENGMALYDPASQSIRTNAFPENFIHKEKVRAIYEDSGHNLYFLPDKGNMLISDLKMSSFYRKPMNPILGGNAYMSVVEDDSNWIWLGCDDGIFRIKHNEETYYIYNFSDGIPSPTFTNNAAYKDENGVLWFGNAKGLLFIDSNHMDEASRNPYQIVFTEIQLNGNKLDASACQQSIANNDLVVKHNQNNVTLGFVNLSYTDPSTMVYEYKLDGLETEWQYITGKNRISYYDLSSGSYTFRIRTPGNEDSEVSLKITVLPMFSIWFWIVALLLAFALYWFSRSWFIKMKRLLIPVPADKSKVSAPAPVSEPVATKPVEEKYKTNRLSEEECKSISDKLSRYMEREKPYTNADLKIRDLAQGIDTSSHSLSYFFNQYLNQSYYDYINEYRIQEFKKLVNDARYSRYTLSALAELCGFSSRASFFRSFKKHTGITPNEYIRRIGGTNE